MDTGIDLLHPTFEGRAVWGFDAVSGASHSLGDRHGHGTYVAGLVVGQHHGIARKSSVIDVRALDENGRGTSVQILSALNYIAGVLFVRIQCLCLKPVLCGLRVCCQRKVCHTYYQSKFLW